jgi:hypothetical protein
LNEVEELQSRLMMIKLLLLIQQGLGI